jgi:DNA-binding NtrC family response regulator
MLLRAQLVEEGFEVLAAESWAAARRALRPGSKPRLVIVDLQGLGNPAGVLNDLAALMTPVRVIVLAAIGSMPASGIRRLGFHVLQRPVAIGDIVAAARQAIAAAESRQTSG